MIYCEVSCILVNNIDQVFLVFVKPPKSTVLSKIVFLTDMMSKLAKIMYFLRRANNRIGIREGDDLRFDINIGRF